MADKTVKVNLKARPKGELIEVPSLGLFENGKTTKLTDEQVHMYENGSAYGARTFPEGGLVLTDEPEEGDPWVEPAARATEGSTTFDYTTEEVEAGAEAVSTEPTEPTSEKGGK